jgi:hypothetical protein
MDRIRRAVLGLPFALALKNTVLKAAIHLKGTALPRT